MGAHRGATAGGPARSTSLIHRPGAERSDPDHLTPETWNMYGAGGRVGAVRSALRGEGRVGRPTRPSDRA